MIEAEAVATAVINHARSSETLSLGIVTFSTAQRDAITDLLEIKRRTDLTLDEFLREGKAEDVFVKDLENVQGDERDVIFVSVGYGPRIAGARLDSMGFGPVSSEGGERRLNVLFTRARNRCEVFASFAAGDIDCDRAKGQGPRVLKRFLQYAETGVLEEHGPTSKDFDSPFEETVAAAIESLGYKVDKQVGSAGFKIDLAVRHPKEAGRYILAVECDGATHHSALWARERDRLRQDVLENLGWRFLRIWSTDWFYRRDDQIGKLKNALNDALHSKPVKRRPEHVAPPSSLHTAVPPEPGSDFKLPTYKVATCSVPHASEPHEVPTSVLTQIVHSIVTQEGPIHQDEVARRVAALFGKERTGSRIVNATHRVLRHHAHKPPLFNQGDFWMTKDQSDNPPVRDRSEAPLSLQCADMLPPIEIKAAVKIAVEQNGSLSDNDLPIAVARLLGFQRTGSDLKSAILKAR